MYLWCFLASFLMSGYSFVCAYRGKSREGTRSVVWCGVVPGMRSVPGLKTIPASQNKGVFRSAFAFHLAGLQWHVSSPCCCFFFLVANLNAHIILLTTILFLNSSTIKRATEGKDKSFSRSCLRPCWKRILVLEVCFSKMSFRRWAPALSRWPWRLGGFVSQVQQHCLTFPDNHSPASTHAAGSRPVTQDVLES